MSSVLMAAGARPEAAVFKLPLDRGTAMGGQTLI
jgi:hypothetical protein